MRVLVEERRYVAQNRSDSERALAQHAWFGRSMGEAPGVDGGIYFTGDASRRIREGHAGRRGPFDFFGRLTAEIWQRLISICSGRARKIGGP